MAEQPRSVAAPPASAADQSDSTAERSNAHRHHSGGLIPDQHTDDVPSDTFDGVPASTLARWLGVPAIHVFARVGSTLDVAHELAAAGAPEHTLVLADMQTRGRGRAGKRWTSPAGSGIWLTLVARPATMESVRVLTVRLGLAAAAALDVFAESRIGVKWPNDLFVGTRKVAGILVEARWRGASPEWLAIGFGVNVTPPPDAPMAGHLATSTSRVDVLRTLVPALQSAVARHESELDAAELAAWTARDLAVGRRVNAPVRGVVTGIDRTAALLVHTEDGPVAISSGSLVLSEES